MSLPQRVARLALEAMRIEHNVERRVGPYYVDFLLPERGLVIEIDGDYWHKLPRVQRKAQERDAYLASLGLRVAHLDGKELLTAPKERIQEVLDAAAHE